MRFVAPVNAGQRENRIARASAMIRDDIKAATIAAMKGGDKDDDGTLRLGPGGDQEPRHRSCAPVSAPKDDDALVTEVLQKMIKQRRESAELYRKGGREDRAAAEEAEITVIERFLPAAAQRRRAEARSAPSSPKPAPAR